MDRRQRKTHRAIFDAFESLVAEQHYASITIAQIIERADIGRSTFYAHFATKDALLDELCAELFAHVFDGVELAAYTQGARGEATLEEMLAHLLCHLRDNHRGICGKLLAEGEPHFCAYFRTALGGFFACRLPERSSWVPADLMQALLVSSFCEAVTWWHEGDYEATPGQLAHWYTRTMGWETARRTSGDDA